MRHKNAGRKFDRNSSSRKAMFRNLAANLILNEKIETTDAKAKVDAAATSLACPGASPAG